MGQGQNSKVEISVFSSFGTIDNVPGMTDILFLVFDIRPKGRGVGRCLQNKMSFEHIHGLKKKAANSSWGPSS